MINNYKDYKYSIEDNKVSIWMVEENPDIDKPSLFQPFDPHSGVEFESEEMAKAWAENHIETNYVNPKILPYPPYIRMLLNKPIEELAMLREEIKIELPEDLQTKITEYLSTQTPPTPPVTE